MKCFLILLFLFMPFPALTQNQIDTSDSYKNLKKWYENERKLYAEAEKGDRAALDAFMWLFKEADGETAEDMVDKLEDFFLKHPRLVLKNWKLLMDEKNEHFTTDALESLCD